MNLNIKYFGMLAEVTKCQEERVSFSDGTVSELLNTLFNKYPGLKATDFQVAQNQEIISKNSMVSDVEIALLPPFAGG